MTTTGDAILSDAGCTPIVAQHREGGGIVIRVGSMVVALNGREADRLAGYLNA